MKHSLNLSKDVEKASKEYIVFIKNGIINSYFIDKQLFEMKTYQFLLDFKNLMSYIFK